MVGGTDKLRRFFELQRVYDSLYKSYVARGVSRTLDPNDKENRFEEEWHVGHYFGVGADALRIIVTALIDGLREPPRTILDFPCGSGRVTRHLRAFFTEADIFACDLYRVTSISVPRSSVQKGSSRRKISTKSISSLSSISSSVDPCSPICRKTCSGRRFV